MKVTRAISLLLCFGLIVSACATSGERKKKSTVKKETTQQLGYVLAGYNVSVDGQFDPKVSDIIEGYTAFTIAIANKSFKPLSLRPDKDLWQIKDRDGKWYRAINDIQFEAADRWEQLHPDAQRLLAYPVVVPAGYTQTFEVFLKGQVDLRGFLAIKHYNAGEDVTWTFTRY